MPSTMASTVLKAEHSVLRQTIATTNALLRAGQWRQRGPALRRLRELLEFDEEFLRCSHRPKCALLAEALRGRSAELDGMFASLRQEQLDDAASYLAVVRATLAVEIGEPHADEMLQTLLEQRHERALQRLEWEGTVLLPNACGALTSAEWRRITGAFEGVLYPSTALYQPDSWWAAGRRSPETRARFENTSFGPGTELDFDRVPRFHSRGLTN